MIPEFTSEATFEELLRPAMAIARRQRVEEAEEYVAKYVAYLLDKHPDWSHQDAHDVVMSNLGYYAGYFGQETRDAVYEVFGAEHPVFGKRTPSPAEAFRAGLRWADEAVR